MTETDVKQFDISKSETLQKWVSEHPKLVEYLSFEEQLASSSIFYSPRNSKAKTDTTIYSKYITQLKTFLTLVQHEKDLVVESLTAASSQPIMKVGKACFEKSELNMLLHQICFAYRHKQHLELELSNLKFSLYTEEEEMALCLINLFQNSQQIIPPNCVVRIKNGQFFFVPYPPEWGSISFKIDSLAKYLERNNSAIEKEKLPLWVTNFPSYFNTVLNENSSLFNSDLSYIPMQPCETYIEKAIYAGFCDEFGIKEKIDEMVKNFKTMVLNEPEYDTKPKLFDKYMKYLLDAIISLGSSFQSRKEPINQNYQSMSLLIFFRIVFDRLYEKYHDKLFQYDSTFELKIVELSKSKVSHFNLPKGFSSQSINPEQSIRDVFRSDQYFQEAVNTIEMISFINNPIDQLYLFNNTIQSVNLAIMKHKMIQKENQNEPQAFTSVDCLSFDDLFVLLLGVLAASNSPEFASIAHFLKRFSPTFCLSNAFEYAQAGVESLLLHITSLDVDEGKNQPD